MTIPLNIVLTYPVRWSTYEIFRDYIQNFYDSVGFTRWKDDFHYAYDAEQERLTMWVDGETFSYEWLLHIGASTKTGSSGNMAGYFGEGFKIASLCAVRDMHWDVEMCSLNWRIRAIVTDQTIDHQNVKMLSYDYEEVESINRSDLKLGHVDACQYKWFQTALLSFFYPDNPLIGEKIWCGSSGAVYARSRNEYPINLPYTSDFGRKGVVFCAYQLLGSNPFDLVVCQHNYRNQDRERRSLYAFDVVNVFEAVSRNISPEGAVIMLEKMRLYWRSYPGRKYDIRSWYTTICNLIYAVSRSQQAIDDFRKKNPALVCVSPIRTVKARNRRWQALSWLKQQKEKYILVQEQFALLDYKSLETLCEQNGGFVRNDIPDELENNCFDILEEITRQIFPDFFEKDRPMPARKVIRNDTASYLGMATVFKKHKFSESECGNIIRYDVSEIYLKRTLFCRSGFYEALSTYIHETCHSIGGDSSHSFSQVLTKCIERLLLVYPVIQKYHERWLMLYPEKNNHTDERNQAINSDFTASGHETK